MGLKKTLWLSVVPQLLLHLTVYAQESTIERLEKEIEELVERVTPSVVTVSAILEYNLTNRVNPFGLTGDNVIEDNPIEITNIGSGIVIDSTHIITKMSIIQGSNEIEVSFFDSSKCNGEVLGTDSQFGIAVLEVDKTGLIPVTKQENGQLKLGKHVFIVGNSLGISPAVSPGIINCIRTDGIIQLSANVPAGNAGGPLFDCRGRLVGLLDAQVTPMPDEIFTGWPNAFQQTVLAIPTERVYSCAEQIIRENSEPKGWFGATGEDMPPNNPRGVHIIKIAAGGPADRAGLQVGDLITGMNGYKVNQAIQMRDLVRQHKPGDSIQVNFSRGETKHSITLQLGNEKDHERPASGFSISSDIYSAPFPVKSSEVDLSNQLTVDPRISRRELIRRMNRMQRELDNLKVLIDQSR